MIKFATPYNFEPVFDSVDDPDSVTVPDQCLSIREIFERYRDGRPLTSKYSEHDGWPSREPDFDDYQRYEDGDYDLSDLADYRVQTEQLFEQFNKEEYERNNRKRFRDTEEKKKVNGGIEQVTEEIGSYAHRSEKSGGRGTSTDRPVD